jgi:hypothetical protein
MNRALACQPPGETDRPLVLGEWPSAFAARWKLLDQLHGAYADNEAGEAAIDWLSQHAAFTRHVDPLIELSAFAERFAPNPLAVDDADLRALRDRFDELSDRTAEPLGHKVAAVLLLDGYVYKAGKQQKLKVSPVAAYLPRTIDSDHPNWLRLQGWQATEVESVAGCRLSAPDHRQRPSQLASRGGVRFRASNGLRRATTTS